MSSPQSAISAPDAEPEIDSELVRRRHVLVQASVAPLDSDGRFAGIVGSLLFAIAAVIIAIIQQTHPAAVPYWYPWVALTGLGLGLIYLSYCTLRGFTAHRPGGEH